MVDQSTKLFLELLPIPARLARQREAEQKSPEVKEERSQLRDLGEEKLSYIEETKAAESRFRYQLRGHLALSDKVEILLLNPVVQAGAQKEELFATDTSGRLASILQRRMLKPAEIKKLVPTFLEAIEGDDETNMSETHVPLHGLRIWWGSDLLYEGSICWPARNFVFTYPNGVRGLLKTTAAFEKTMNELLTIPPDLAERAEQQVRSPAIPSVR